MESPQKGGAGNEFTCNMCKVACSSTIDLESHFLGSKHKLMEKVIEERTCGSPETTETWKVAGAVISAPVRVPVSLGDELEGYRSTEPAIGLEYVVEYRSQGILVYYECQLCERKTDLRNMFFHVVGAKHRRAYLKKHYPDMAEVVGRGSEANKQLKEFAAEVEARDGRKKIRVMTDTLKRKRRFEEDAAGPNKNKCIDFTRDEFFDPPPPVPSQSMQAESVIEQGLDESVDGFATKKEFLEYLRGFKIRCEDDAAFVRTVTRHFKQSLFKYRDKIKEDEEAAALPVTSPTQQRPNSPHPTGQNIYRILPKNMPGQQAPVSGTPSSVYNASPPPLAPAKTMDLPGCPRPLNDTNKATIIEFFSRIRNLDVEQVSAILHKIAATKPAFKDMDIPNVIKMLQETGSLKPKEDSNQKPSNSGSSQS